MINLERVINVFDKKTEKLIQEVNIDNVNIDILKSIFSVNNDDPSMYDPYTIYKDEALALSVHLKSIILFDFENYSYQLDCYKV